MSTVADASPRLDVWLVRERAMTRHAAQTLIAAGYVTVNGRLAKAGQRVRDGDTVLVAEAPSETGRRSGWADRGRKEAAVAPAADGSGSGRREAPAQRQPREAHTHRRPRPPHDDSGSLHLTVVYEDDWLAVVDKPAGMVVHPAAGHREGTLVDALRARGTTWSLLGGAERAGIVHRLDRDTSGLLVVAKTETAHRALSAQLKERTLGRTYWAAVHGGFRETSGTIDAPIARDPRDRKRMGVVDGGRVAITDFRVIERRGDVSLLEISLRTGRTHQIRVHAAYIKHPIVGDSVYGRRSEPPGRPALHATALTLVHPADGARRTFTSPLPPDLEEFVLTLRDGSR